MLSRPNAMDDSRTPDVVLQAGKPSIEFFGALESVHESVLYLYGYFEAILNPHEKIVLLPCRTCATHAGRRTPRIPTAANQVWTTPARSFKPSACVNLRIVAKLGLPSPESALYKRSRPSPVSLANCDMLRVRAMAPSALAMKAASPPASSRQASKYRKRRPDYRDLAANHQPGQVLSVGIPNARNRKSSNMRGRYQRKSRQIPN